MAIQNGFFKSINGDRRYLAEFFTSYFASFIGNGVFPNPSTNLQVINNQNFSTIVRPGKGWINGHYLNNDDNIVINHQPPDGVLRRIDRIVFSVNLDSRSMDIYLKQGTPSTNAVAPALIRNSTLYELALADIAFNPGATSISQSNITDQRMNRALCGIVHGVVEQLDTTTLFNQYQQFLVEKGVEFDQQLAVNQQIFDDWFAQLNDILDGDVAANLANMIITHTNNATPQKHIEVVSEIPQNLANKGLLLVVDDVDNPNNAPQVPTSVVLSQRIDEVTSRVKDGFISASFFGIKGDNSTETASLQSAIDYCFENKLILNIGGLTIRTNSIIIKCDLIGSNGTILFNKNHGFTNFEPDGSRRYLIKKLQGVRFESDKESSWSSAEAGESFVSNISDPKVRRIYGQRVYIGNKTTTPNNILSNVASEQQNGTGFWNKYFNHWTNANDIDFNNVSAAYNNYANKDDTNTLSMQGQPFIITGCEFVGFGVGLTLKGTYKGDINNNLFARCGIAVACLDGQTLPGSLSDINAKCTTLKFDDNEFTDISIIGIYGYSFLQSNVSDNVFQPVKVATTTFYGAENLFKNNYFEICHTGGVFGTNGCFGNVWESNFCNISYTTYQVRVQSGNNNKFKNANGNKNLFIQPTTIRNVDFDETFNVSQALLGTNTLAFYNNGNSQNRESTKYAIVKITGTNGTGFTRELKKTNRPADVSPSFVASQAGIFLNGNEEILNVEYLSVPNKNKFIGYFDIANNGTDRTVYIDKLDSGTITRDDFRLNGEVNVLKILFKDGYSTT